MVLDEIRKIPKLFESLSGPDCVGLAVVKDGEFCPQFDLANTAPEIRVAVNWWSKRLAGPAEMNVGDRKNSVLLTIASCTRLKLSDQQIAKFATIFGWMLEKMLMPNASASVLKTICLSVDYDPCREIEFAAVEAGINPQDRLPAKTVMWIDPGRVQVKEGYGRPFLNIYQP